MLHSPDVARARGIWIQRHPSVPGDLRGSVDGLRAAEHFALVFVALQALMDIVLILILFGSDIRIR